MAQAPQEQEQIKPNDENTPSGQKTEEMNKNQAPKEDNQAEAIKFIKSKLQSSFDEQSAKKLFEFYTLDKNTQRLQPPDVRKLLLDVLQSFEWPLVVPDVSLNNVLHELCLNDEGSISWIEFKSFFVFLQDKPLYKLFQITTKLFDKKQISLSRLINIKPAKLALNNQQQQNDDNVDENNDDDNKNEKKEENANYYDRDAWKSAVKKLIPQCTNSFIYFMDGYQILALVIGNFDEILAEPASAEINLNDSIYLAKIRAFDMDNDVFPPIARSGGIKSKVARKIADSYIIARQWDEKHLKIAQKAGAVVNKISIKWTEFEKKYQVQEKVNATTTSIFAAVKAFDEKHQLTRRLSSGAKQFNEKYGVTEKLNSAVDKVKSNEKVQIVSNKVSETVSSALKAVDDIGQETKQLVQEKRQQVDQENDDNDNDQPQQQEQQNEGGNDNNNPSAPPEEINNEQAVQVQSQ